MRILAFLFAGSMLFAQLESNTVTVQAVRGVTAQPDQAVYAVAVAAPASASLEDVVASVQGAGITAAQFTGVSGPAQLVDVTGLISTQIQSLQWSFTVVQPIAKLKNTADTLTAVKQSLAQKANGFTLSFSLAGTQASQQSQCPVSDLIADARTQAQRLAVAGGLTLGPIVALSNADSTGFIRLIGISGISPPNVRSGDFAGGIIPVDTGFASFLLGIPSTLPPVQPLICFLTVKFGATHY